jgi:hypothetical protein
MNDGAAERSPYAKTRGAEIALYLDEEYSCERWTLFALPVLTPRFHCCGLPGIKKVSWTSLHQNRFKY